MEVWGFHCVWSSCKRLRHLNAWRKGFLETRKDWGWSSHSESICGFNSFCTRVGGFFEGFWSDSTTVAALATPHDFLHCNEESCSHCGAQCYTWGPSQTATGSHTSKGHTRKTWHDLLLSVRLKDENEKDLVERVDQNVLTATIMLVLWFSTSRSIKLQPVHGSLARSRHNPISRLLNTQLESSVLQKAHTWRWLITERCTDLPLICICNQSPKNFGDWKVRAEILKNLIRTLTLAGPDQWLLSGSRPLNLSGYDPMSTWRNGQLANNLLDVFFDGTSGHHQPCT